MISNANLHTYWNYALSYEELAIWNQDDSMEAGSTCTAEDYKVLHSCCRKARDASNTSSAVISSGSRDHSRLPSARSSFVTKLDSPVSAIDLVLQDLVEEPTEKSELTDHDGLNDAFDEHLCICDGLFCEHHRSHLRLAVEATTSSAASRRSDRSNSDSELFNMTCTERRGSGDSSRGGISIRMNPRWPSLSNCLRDRKTKTSSSRLNIRSAPPSRSSSPRNLSNRRPLAYYHGVPASMPAIGPPNQLFEENDSKLPASSCCFSTACTAFKSRQELEQDPVERQMHSTTPLLPPVTTERGLQMEDSLQSPLQSPTIATRSVTETTVSSPLTSPGTYSVRSPSLSAKPSFSSIGMGLTNNAAHTSSGIPHLSMSEETDEWAIKLGHANFHIVPEPYVPDTCNFQSCQRLLEDWKAAQVEYLRQTARISEHHGPTSSTYKIACQKWEHIEATWHLHFLHALEQAEANGETVNLKPLQEAQSFSIPDKFPDIDDADIVGPMVQYTKIDQSSPKSTLVRLFTAPTSILRKSQRP